MRMNEPARALSDFNKAISIDPNYHEALNNRGALLVNSFQKYDDAIADFNKAINLNPAGSYYLNRSICYYKMGQFKNAISDADIAVKKGESIPAVYQPFLEKIKADRRE